MSRLILTVGLPRAGKTTWALTTGHPIVNPDSIRYALHGQRFFAPAEPFVWAMAFAMVDALFHAGHEAVIVDATNVSTKRREAWVERFASRAQVTFHVISTDSATCIERAKAEGDETIIPVIERMAREWDLPVPWSRATPLSPTPKEYVSCACGKVTGAPGWWENCEAGDAAAHHPAGCLPPPEPATDET